MADLVDALRSPCGIGAPSDHSQMEIAAGAIERLRAALTEIRDDDAGDKAYGYKDVGMAFDRVQRIARDALLAD